MDLPIPGNDDGIRSIELITKILADAVIDGAGSVGPSKDADAAVKAEPAECRPRKLSSRGGERRRGRVDSRFGGGCRRPA